MSETAIQTGNRRKYLPEDFRLTAWEALEPLYKDLLGREINSAEDLSRWLSDRSELDAAVSEDCGWRYIRTTGDTASESYKKTFEDFVAHIQPRASVLNNRLDLKLLKCPYIARLEGDRYRLLLKRVRKQSDIFREENVSLKTREELMEKEYNVLSGAMMIRVDGEEVTLPQASKRLMDPDRGVREKVHRDILERRKKDAVRLDSLFSELADIRHCIAINAGFSNYRDYKFAELGRFDYTVQSCLDFHDSVQKEVLPVIDELYKLRREALGVKELRPWDLSVDFTGKPPLRPFSGGEELLDKAIECLNGLRPFFGECLQTMKNMGRLDLESRMNKAPGGYNYPLYETGVPFIFMNAAGSMRDVVTMVHEAGHAIHSFLTRDLELVGFRSLTSEIAELASMSMELFSMESWGKFLDNPADLKRARFQQLERVINIFPWVAAVDKFQHWVYTHPGHTVENRSRAWVDIYSSFCPPSLNWDGLEDDLALGWQKQLHIFEMPFYYIEYAIAQLGAVSMWKQFRENREKALDNYTHALSLGYTLPIPEIYSTAGIRFDFSGNHVRELIQFVRKEMEAIA